VNITGYKCGNPECKQPRAGREGRCTWCGDTRIEIDMSGMAEIKQTPTMSLSVERVISVVSKMVASGVTPNELELAGKALASEEARLTVPAAEAAVQNVAPALRPYIQDIWNISPGQFYFVLSLVSGGLLAAAGALQTGVAAAVAINTVGQVVQRLLAEAEQKAKK